MTSSREMESRFLGCLMGLAIGDALGMPFAAMQGSDNQDKGERIIGYLPRSAGTEDEIPAGEITDETEIVLCIVESMTTNDGLIDEENINARLMFLAQGASQRWMPPEIRSGILLAAEHDGIVPREDDREPSLAVAVRGIPIGLIHSVGALDADALAEDVRRATRLTHAGAVHDQLVLDVALGIIDLLRDEKPASIDIGEGINDVGDLRATIAEFLAEAESGSPFDDVVLKAVNEHRPPDSAGAIAGAFAGARRGASGIPQELIDGLGARIYLTLAAPWFYRTALRRAGTLIDLRNT